MLQDESGELTCSLELEQLSDLLTTIGCKLPYRMEVSGRMFKAALEEGRLDVAAKAMADSWIMESVLLEEAKDEEESEWRHVAKSKFVWIGGSIYTMFV